MFLRLNLRDILKWPMMMLEGRPPSKLLLGFASCLPQAKAMIWAATLAHSFCWLVLPWMTTSIDGHYLDYYYLGTEKTDMFTQKGLWDAPLEADGRSIGMVLKFN